MANPLADATSKLLDVLTPLVSEERHRVVRAALMLLGDDAGPVRSAPIGAGNEQSLDKGDEADFLPMGAKVWIKKTGITLSQLEHYFHFDQGKVLPIALPGHATAKSEQTIHTYLVQGIASLLENGEAAFTDEQARRRCEHFGCYDSGNHTRYLKALGNKATGSKSSGWKLTTPGMSSAAELIKQSPGAA